MKLLRVGPVGQEKPAAIDAGGKIRDLSSKVADIDGRTVGAASLAALKKLDLTSLPELPASERIGACVGNVGNFVAVGLNFADHAAETGAAIPAEPIIFNKARSCIGGPNDDVVIPRGSTKLDWEVELAIVIGEKASYVSEADAMKHVAGFCICNDVSERVFQNERGGSWSKGKGCPTFGPLGPWLVTPDEIADVQNLDMWLEVDGKRMQTGSTKTMIFGVAYLVSYISQFMILEPGDVITTGTPPGVGLGMKPPKFLAEGNVITIGIQGLGSQRQLVVR